MASITCAIASKKFNSYFQVDHLTKSFVTTNVAIAKKFGKLGINNPIGRTTISIIDTNREGPGGYSLAYFILWWDFLVQLVQKEGVYVAIDEYQKGTAHESEDAPEVIKIKLITSIVCLYLEILILFLTYIFLFLINLEPTIYMQRPLSSIYHCPPGVDKHTTRRLVGSPRMIQQHPEQQVGPVQEGITQLGA